MKIFLFFVTLSYFLLNESAIAADLPPLDTLRCSSNGTKVIYVNGVLAPETKVNRTKELIRKTLEKDFNLIDYNGTVIVEHVWNRTFGLGNDGLELVVQRLRTKGVKDPWKYIKLIQLGFKNLPTGKLLTGLFADFNQLSYNMVAEEIAEQVALSTNQLKSADEELAKKIAVSIKNKLINNEKIIIIAHSQGNAAIASAATFLPNSIDGENKTSKYLGALHVATPISERAAVKSRLIKLYNDYVVSNPIVGASSEKPNYALKGTEVDFLTNWLNNVYYATVLKSDWLNHGMSEVYLSSTLSAHKIGESVDFSMQDIFKKNIFELAHELEDNCQNPVIKLTSTEATENEEGDLEVSGLADLNRKILLKVKDVAINSDPAIAKQRGYDQSKTTFTWKIEKIYPPYPGKPLQGTVILTDNELLTEKEILLPYRDIGYKVTILAENAFGKTSTRTYQLKIKNNRAPILDAVNSVCLKDGEGYISGIQETLIKVSDDQYLFDGNSYRVTSQIGEPVNFPFSDGLVTTTLNVPNSCLSEVPVYRYDFTFSCQHVLIPGQESSLDPQFTNSGIQWTQVSIWNDHGTNVKHYDLPESNNRLTPFDYPVQIYGTNEYFSVTLGNRCPLGEKTSAGNWSVFP